MWSSKFFYKIYLNAGKNLAKSYRRSYGIKAVISKDNNNLEIEIQNKKDVFPLVWLRDNCTCESCFDRNSQSRIINWNKFSVDVSVQDIQVINNNIKILWQDKHSSIFEYNWLEEHSFTEDNQIKHLSNTYGVPKVLWDKTDFTKIFHCSDFNELLTSDNSLYEWLRNLATYGVGLINNAPKNENECRKIINRIGFGKRTHYGAEYHVKNKGNANNLAYIPKLLQLHTDLPFYSYKPGTIFLHCIEQTKTKGGENLLTDGFYVAKKLRKANKEVFDILANTPVNWFDEGVDDQMEFNKVYRAPVICLNTKGEVQSINHNIGKRDSYFTVELETVKLWYKALKVFVESINEHAVEFKLQPGQILAIDNLRLLHGRYSYEDTADIQRFLVGIYMDWDEIYSKIRVLQNNLKIKI